MYFLKEEKEIKRSKFQRFFESENVFLSKLQKELQFNDAGGSIFSPTTKIDAYRQPLNSHSKRVDGRLRVLIEAKGRGKRDGKRLKCNTDKSCSNENGFKLILSGRCTRVE